MIVEASPTQSSVLQNSGHRSKDLGKSSVQSKASSNVRAFENRQVYIDKSSKINYGTFKMKQAGYSRAPGAGARGKASAVEPGSPGYSNFTGNKRTHY